MSASRNHVADHVERLGYRVLELNARTRFGFIGVVALDGDDLVFVNAGPTQLAARNRASSWIARNERPLAREIRFDTVSTVQTVGGALLSLEHVVGAA